MNKSLFFFKDLVRNYKKSDVKLVLVTHLLIDRPEFIDGILRVLDLALIIPKPKTIDKNVLEKLKKFKILNITRNELNKKNASVRLLKKYIGSNKFIISDIGGYFSQSLFEIKDYFGDQFLGIVEDTENGFQKYSKIKKVPCPVFSVARSPLKLPEDTLVAYSTVYSAERILREKNEVLGGKRAVILGFGKIGSRIAKDLSRKQVITKVYDIDPIKLVYALSEGFEICNKKTYLKNIDLIFSVTGNKCLNNNELNKLKGKIFIFSITSSDDEFDFQTSFSFKNTKPSRDTILRNEKPEIHLINHGNAVNFLHGAVVGNFIRLVQAEIILAIISLINDKNPNEIIELSDDKRRLISSFWLKYFG